MFKNKKKKNEAEEVQELCPENASLWTKLHNEPYLRTHPKMLVGYLAYSAVIQYVIYLGVVFAFAYLGTVVAGAAGVLWAW